MDVGRGGSADAVVVVGFDGQWRTRDLLQVAADEAMARRAALAVVTVLRPVGDLARSVRDLQAEDERERAVAETLLAQAAASARGARPGLVVMTHCLTEDDVEGGREPLASADLLVVGARGQYGRVALGLESVSRALLKAARCPVQLVPEDPAVSAARAARTDVLAAVSEHPADAEVVVAAAVEAARRGSGLRLLHAYRRWPGEPPGDAVRRGAEVLAAALDGDLTAPDVRRSALLIEADAAAAIAAAAQDSALVVLGSRPGSLAGLVLDSVSRAVVASAPCRVLLLPRPPAPER